MGKIVIYDQKEELVHQILISLADGMFKSFQIFCSNMWSMQNLTDALKKYEVTWALENGTKVYFSYQNCVITSKIFYSFMFFCCSIFSLALLHMDFYFNILLKMSCYMLGPLVHLLSNASNKIFKHVLVVFVVAQRSGWMYRVLHSHILIHQDITHNSFLFICVSNSTNQ